MRQAEWFHVVAALRALGVTVEYPASYPKHVWLQHGFDDDYLLQKLTVSRAVQRRMLQALHIDEAAYLAALPAVDAPNTEPDPTR